MAITGAARGLGRAMAVRFAAEGASLALVDTDRAGVEQVAHELAGAHGVTVTSDRVDVTSSASVDEWIGMTAQRHGHLDVLVSNAGVLRDGRVETMSDAAWRAVVDVSMTGAFHGIRSALGVMKQQRYGRLLSLSSMSWRGNFGQANYAAAKAGIVGLTRTVALEAAGHGITANAIAPGLIDTPMLASIDASARELLTRRIPIGHIGQPPDIAAAAAFLCSREAGYITGVVLDVDGGIGIGASIR